MRLKKSLFTLKKKKRSLFDYKKVQKKHFFSKGLTHAFGQKMPFFSLFRLDQNNTRNNAF